MRSALRSLLLLPIIAASAGALAFETGHVSLLDLAWKKTGRNSDRITGSFTVQNDNPFGIKYFYAQCHLFDIDRAAFPPQVNDISEPVPANSRQVFRDFTLARDISPATSRVTCEVVQFKADR